MTAAPDDEARLLIALTRERLEVDGWQVELHSSSERSVDLRFEHELSTQAGCSFNPQLSESDRRRFLDRFLGKREFRVISERPTETPHASLIQRFRQAAQANRWSTDVLAIVARVLQHERLLTDAEAEWLEHAGPAWHQEDARAGS